MNLLLHVPDIAPREAELVRAAPEMDLVNSIVGPVKISKPGLQKAKTEARKSKKKGK